MTSSRSFSKLSLYQGFIFIVVFFVSGCRGPLNLSNIPQPILPFKPVTNRVILIVFENQKYGAVIGNPRAPYLNSLADRFAVAGNFFANTHPSIGDYFMLTTGQIISNDLVFEGIITQDNIVRQLGQNSMDWKAYLQSIPQPGYTGDRAYPYAKPHVPFAYFGDIIQFPSQAVKMVGTDGFLSDVALDDLPAYVYITADQKHNMHDCASGVAGTCTNDDKIAQGDAWLQQTLDPVIASAGFQAHNTLIIVTWDESFDKDDENGGGHIPVLLISPDAKPGFVSQTFYQHESVLRLIEERLGLPATLGAAATAPSMQEFFQPAVTAAGAGLKKRPGQGRATLQSRSFIGSAVN